MVDWMLLAALAEEKQKIKASVQVAMQRPEVQDRLRTWQGRSHSPETKVAFCSLSTDTLQVAACRLTVSLTPTREFGPTGFTIPWAHLILSLPQLS